MLLSSYFLVFTLFVNWQLQISNYQCNNSAVYVLPSAFIRSVTPIPAHTVTKIAPAQRALSPLQGT